MPKLLCALTFEAGGHLKFRWIGRTLLLLSRPSAGLLWAAPGRFVAKGHAQLLAEGFAVPIRRVSECVPHGSSDHVASLGRRPVRR